VKQTHVHGRTIPPLHIANHTRNGLLTNATDLSLEVRGGVSRRVRRIPEVFGI